MKEILKLGFVLLLICVISASLLAMTYDATKEPIATQRAVADENAREDVLPIADSFEKISDEEMKSINDKNDKVVEVYKGIKDGVVSGYVIKTVPGGYGGAVQVITGISLDGKITGVRIGTHQETPGLGAKATLPEFYGQYEGMNTAGGIGVSKTAASDTEIKAISGATITSAAVTTGVNFSIEVVNELNK